MRMEWEEAPARMRTETIQVHDPPYPGFDAHSCRQDRQPMDQILALSGAGVTLSGGDRVLACVKGGEDCGVYSESTDSWGDSLNMTDVWRYHYAAVLLDRHRWWVTGGIGRNDNSYQL